MLLQQRGRRDTHRKDIYRSDLPCVSFQPPFSLIFHRCQPRTPASFPSHTVVCRQQWYRFPPSCICLVPPQRADRGRALILPRCQCPTSRTGPRCRVAVISAKPSRGQTCTAFVCDFPGHLLPFCSPSFPSPQRSPFFPLGGARTQKRMSR